jgi:hypothetical protein
MIFINFLDNVIFFYIFSNPNYFEDSGWIDMSPINSIQLKDIIDIENKKITSESIDRLKLITNLGYNFNKFGYNDIIMSLCRSTYSNNILIPGLESFIEWLLENYPDNYLLCKEILPYDLKKKFEYLDKAVGYNL